MRNLWRTLAAGGRKDIRGALQANHGTTISVDPCGWQNNRADTFQRRARQCRCQVAGTIEVKTVGWAPTCACESSPVPATVLDPFIGSGTTVKVAQSLGRAGVGVDLNPDYLDIARRIIEGVTLPLQFIPNA